MTLTTTETLDTITTNQPPATPTCGLNPPATCRAKSETPHPPRIRDRNCGPEHQALARQPVRQLVQPHTMTVPPGVAGPRRWGRIR
jgi:hypothetical protein